MTIARFATIFIIRVFGTHLWRSLWVLRLFTFFRNVVFELVHAFACSRDWSFPLLINDSIAGLSADFWFIIFKW